MDTRRTAYLAMAGPDDRLRLRAPTPDDGAALHDLIRRSPPLDLNSCYAYLLHGLHFADTCVLAEDDDGLAAYISGYRPPARADTLFIWQVAVDQRHRGRGLARRLLRHLLSRPACAGVRWLDTTVSPGNAPSSRVFRGLAAELGCPCTVSELFGPAHFGGAAHAAEQLFRIGPFSLRQEETPQ